MRDVRAFFDLAGNPRDADAFMRVYYKAHCYIKRRDAEWAVRKASRGKSDILESLVEQMSGYRKLKDVERRGGRKRRQRAWSPKQPLGHENYRRLTKKY